MQARRSAQVLLVAALCVSSVWTTAVAGTAATARVEAESLRTPASCWSTLTWAALSGGGGRSCFSPSAPLTWTVTVPSGQKATVSLFGYRDAVARGYRVRVDNGGWSQGSLSGPDAPSALFFTTAPLSGGSHTVDLESVGGAGGFTLDYYQLDTSSAAPASTTTTTAPASTSTTPTSTTPPAPTTTTVPPTGATLPPTTTIVPPVAAPAPGTCNVDPADGQDAIAAAIRGCADGSTVRFPTARTYHQSGPIAVVGRSNLVIDGNGSTFISSAPNDPWASIYQARPNWQVVEGTKVTLQNMTVRGNLVAGPRGILAGNQYNSGIVVYGGNGIYVTDVSVASVFGEFVVANPSGFYRGGGALDGQVPTNVYITRLKGQGAARQCVSATAAQGFWLQDSSLSDCYQNGVDLEPDVAGERVRDVHILRNTISGYYFSAITAPTAYQTGDVDGVEIRANTTTSTSDTCYPAVLIGGVQGNANLLYNVVVAENTLRTLYEGIKDTSVGSGSVTGNNITITVAPSYCGPPVASPVRLVNSPNVVVQSNATTGYGT